jgi:WD40 repeat protein
MPAGAPESALAADWRALQAQVDDASTDPEKLRRALLQFSSRHPGTPHARQAARLLTQLPSLLDRLRPAPVSTLKPPVPWPKELVVVLGTKDGPGGPRASSVAFSVDGSTLASGDDAGKVHLWDPVTGNQQVAPTTHTSRVTVVAYSPDGRTLASADGEGHVFLSEAASGQVRTRLDANRQEVHALVFSPDGRALASAGADGKVKLWDAATGRERASFQADTRFLSLAFTPDGTALAAGGDDRLVRFWELQGTNGEERTYAGNSVGVHGLVFTPEGRWLISGGGASGALRICDRGPAGLTERSVLDGRGAVVKALRLTPDGQALFTADQKGRIVRWDLKSSKRTQEISLPGPVSGLALAPDGRHLAVACGKGGVCILRVPPPSPTSERPKPRGRR